MSNVPTGQRLLNVQEASQYIGVAKDTLYTMVSHRRVPFVKVGGLLKFDQTLPDGWLKQHTVMPMPEKPGRHTGCTTASRRQC